MLHEPAKQSGDDLASSYKSRLGVRMFFVYAFLYAGFVLINVLWPKTMGIIIVAGLNLAVVYGFFLIVFAIILALIYNWLCSRKEKELYAAQGEVSDES